MIIVQIKEGLGNQMFQYATAYALAKRLNQPLVLFSDKVNNKRPYRLNLLNIDETVIKSNELPLEIKIIKSRYMNYVLRKLNVIKCQNEYQFLQYQLSNWIYFHELHNGFQEAFLSLHAENIFINGFFLSNSLFKEYREDLLSRFTASYPSEPEYTKALNEIRNSNSVAVHVRRGDYKFSKHPYHYLLGEDYYRRAITYVREHTESPVFFWFSEDFEWVYEHFGIAEDFRFINLRTTHRDIDDMLLMKNCNHIISANSTFSWWAAWLNEHENAICIMPEKRFGNEMMLESWIQLPV